MKAEDLQVRLALVQAGYDAKHLVCRGELYDALAKIYQEDPLTQDWVDELREVLSIADEDEERVELAAVRRRHSFILACPECGRKPDASYQSNAGLQLVACMNHEEGAVTQGGATLSEAVARWNSEGWVVNPCYRHPYLL